jgi:hypothetical protein
MGLASAHLMSRLTAGLAISGTASSDILHFIDAVSVETVLRTAVDHLAGRLPIWGAPRPDELGKKTLPSRN